MYPNEDQSNAGEAARSLIESFVAILFRRKWLILTVFASVFGGVATATSLMSPRYVSEMRILVKNERADLVVSPGVTAGQPALNNYVDETVINSEIELLSSVDILKRVVLERGLYARDPAESAEAPPSDLAVVAAVRQLAAQLKILSVSKSSIIQVSYESKTPTGSADVLNTLASAYLEAHLRLHQTPGAQEFFRVQRVSYDTQLQDARAKLRDLEKRSNIYLMAEQKELALRDLMDAQRLLDETEAALAETSSRVATMNAQVMSTSPRVVTQSRVIPSQALVERLTTMLAELDNKRSQLTIKFLPDDRLVREVDEEIENTRRALERAEEMSARDETTDTNPLRRSLEEQLSLARAAQAGLQAKRETLASVTRSKEAALNSLQAATQEFEELQRTIKESEENHQLYVRKEEEARIAGLLDQQKISNVVLAQAPTINPFPSRPNVVLNLALGLVLAGFISIGSAVGLDLVGAPALHTPSDIEAATGLQVLGSIPLRQA